MSIQLKRILMSLCGVIVCAVAVGGFKLAAFGVDPFQCVMSGLDQLIPIDFGTLYVIVNAVLLIFSLVFNRTAIGIATFINLFLLGYITEFTLSFLQSALVAPTVLTRIIVLAVSIAVICLGSSLYMTAYLGVSTYDAVAITVAYKWRIGKFKFVRVITDLVCVVLGILCFRLGGGAWADVPAFVGVGTIITAFFMGPLVDLLNRKVSRPLLGEKMD